MEAGQTETERKGEKEMEFIEHDEIEKEAERDSIRKTEQRERQKGRKNPTLNTRVIELELSNWI